MTSSEGTFQLVAKELVFPRGPCRGGKSQLPPSLPANCQALPEPASRPSLIYKYADLPLFWYANGDMTNY